MRARLALLLLLWLPAGLLRADLVDSEPYDGILRDYVREGWIDYAGLLREQEVLDGYLAQLAQADLEAATVDEQIAFWINAYNAGMLRMVLSHYPIRRTSFLGLLYPENSIRQLGGAWDRDDVEIGGDRFSLNEIEHEILRRRFEEPRVLFALARGTRGSPQLRSEAYAAKALDRQLEDATRAFLANPENGLRVDPAGRTLWLSRIFSWYGRDFVPRDPRAEEVSPDNLSSSEAAVLRFVRPYLGEQARAVVDTGEFSLLYLPYDWRLNGQ